MAHRSLAEWQAIQAQKAAEPQPEPLTEGWMEVKVNAGQDLDGRVRWVRHRAPTVEALKERGYKVLVQHVRYHRRHPAIKGIDLSRVVPVNPMTGKITSPMITTAKGGKTHVIVLAKEGGWAEGHAVCTPTDIFSRKVGYALAVTKALTILNGPELLK